jgi:hypothetical protein
MSRNFLNRFQTSVDILSSSTTPPDIGNFTSRANFNKRVNWNNGIGLTTVGTNGESSYYGTYDQNGNVFEWNEFGILRGGSFSSSNLFLNKLGRLDSSNLSVRRAISLGRSDVGFRIIKIDTTKPADFVYVGDINNQNDVTNYGRVSYFYNISKYTITNCDYIDFLNSVANYDQYGLYNEKMSSDKSGGIVREGSSGNYFYYSKQNMSNKPVVFVSWFNAARYVNWIENNKPEGDQISSTTENGSYTLNGTISGDTVPRNKINPILGISAKYFLPTENEWYKAAYYDPNKFQNNLFGYWNYATKSDTSPVSVTSDEAGNGPFVENAPLDSCLYTYAIKSWTSRCVKILPSSYYYYQFLNQFDLDDNFVP